MNDPSLPPRLVGGFCRTFCASFLRLSASVHRHGRIDASVKDGC